MSRIGMTTNRAKLVDSVGAVDYGLATVKGIRCMVSRTRGGSPWVVLEELEDVPKERKSYVPKDFDTDAWAAFFLLEFVQRVQRDGDVAITAREASYWFTGWDDSNTFFCDLYPHDKRQSTPTSHEKEATKLADALAGAVLRRLVRQGHLIKFDSEPGYGLTGNTLEEALAEHRKRRQ